MSKFTKEINRMKERLLKLKKEIENIELTYDIEHNYTDLLNAVIDFQNETQEWWFDYIFIYEYIDEEVLVDMVKYKIDREGLWSVCNLLHNIDDYTGIYRVDDYGYGHSIDTTDIKYIKDEILNVIDRKLEEIENECNGNASE